MFRLLKAEEIDVRIAKITQYSVKLLLYKDARADMNILDETVGPMNWQRSHTRDNANCIVSIWDDQKEQWISKEDTGTESFTEKEKGLASDSFKRACFNWGIGRELYTGPDISIKPNLCNVKDNKCYDKFTVEEITYKDKNIKTLIIKNQKTGKIVFNTVLKTIDNKTDDGKVTTQMLSDAIKEFGKNDKWAIDNYNKQHNKNITDLKFMAQDSKQAVYTYLKEQKNKTI